jgi:hypothetical protein
MSSKITLDTTTLLIRDLIVINPDTEQGVPDNYIPVIGRQGLVGWKDPYEFLSTVSIPTLSNSFIGMLEMIRPGLSSLSTAFYSTLTTTMTSTVAGLGSIGYVSTSKLHETIRRLGDDGYISSTTLFNCINHLGNLTNLAATLKFTDGVTRNFGNVGYVSTLNPGEYKIYQSSLGLQGNNLDTVAINTGQIRESVVIDIGGFSRHIVGSSKMKIDINTNIWITNPTSALTTVSTFLMTNPLPNPLTSPVGLPVVMSYTSNTTSLGNISFLLNSNDIRNNATLKLCHSINRAGTLTTTIPTVGGIHITLDNTD